MSIVTRSPGCPPEDPPAPAPGTSVTVAATTTSATAGSDSAASVVRGTVAPAGSRRSTVPFGRVALIGLDLVLLGIAFAVAHLARVPWELPPPRPVPGLLELTVAPVITLTWMVLLETFRTRDPRVFGVGDDEYRRLLTASLVTGAVVAGGAYAFNVDLARGYLAIVFATGLALLVVGRKTVRTVIARRRSRGIGLTDVLLVGDVDDVRYVGRRIAASPAAGYRVRGIVTDCVPVGASVDCGPEVTPVVGTRDGLLVTAAAAGVGAVVVAGAVRGGHERLRRLGWELEEHGIELVVSSPLADVAAGRVHERPVAGLPLMHVERPDYSRRTGKRLLDVVGAALGLLVLAPVFLVIAVAIVLDDGRPVLFRQTRVGRRGVPFSILKFRTMSVDAE